jgi:hypothetical protein
MVIALFLQIIVMIIDRYLYKSKTFIAVHERKLNQVRMPLPKEDAKDNNEKLEVESSESEREAKRKRIEKVISLETTKITLAMVSKFYLQWILLIFVHGLVFWFFPIHGNEKLQNQAYCVKDADKLGIKCNEFGGNWALIVFYILYALYFWVSALQIKYGVPEMKKGNFMMNNYSIVNKMGLQVFMAVPFLFELKTFVDWTFTKTALDVF